MTQLFTALKKISAKHFLVAKQKKNLIKEHPYAVRYIMSKAEQQNDYICRPLGRDRVVMGNKPVFTIKVNEAHNTQRTTAHPDKVSIVCSEMTLHSR